MSVSHGGEGLVSMCVLHTPATIHYVHVTRPLLTRLGTYFTNAMVVGSVFKGIRFSLLLYAVAVCLLSRHHVSFGSSLLADACEWGAFVHGAQVPLQRCSCRQASISDQDAAGVPLTLWRHPHCVMGGVLLISACGLQRSNRDGSLTPHWCLEGQKRSRPPIPSTPF